MHPIDSEEAMDSARRPAARRGAGRLAPWMTVFGPGILVMFADTDVGSLITAAQSGAQWGYSLLAAQLLLIPIVFVVQELTVRLGIFTGKGHGELIRDQFGAGWAWLSVITLVVACAGAIVSEMSGIAGVAAIWGIPESVATLAVAAFLVGMVVTGLYRRVERVAIGIGAFELVFLVTMVLSDPQPEQVAQGLATFPIGDPAYMYLVAANIGAVIMPWMIVYQQSAVVDKGLTPRDLRASRWDTAVGSVVTQLVMVGMLATCAATLWATAESGVDLNTVEQISTAITPHLGAGAGRVLFSLGMVGAALVAAIAASLTAAWGLGELTGYRRSLENTAREAPLVLRHVHRRAWRRDRARPGRGQHRRPEHRHPSHECSVAADSPWFPGSAGIPRSPRKPSAARLDGSRHRTDGGGSMRPGRVLGRFRRRRPDPRVGLALVATGGPPTLSRAERIEGCPGTTNRARHRGKTRACSPGFGPQGDEHSPER